MMNIYLIRIYSKSHLVGSELDSLWSGLNDMLACWNQTFGKHFCEVEIVNSVDCFGFSPLFEFLDLLIFRF